MRKLYHLWLCPFSRKVRIALKEKKLDFDLSLELPWKNRKEFLELNPSGEIPVLVDEQAIVICDSNAIVEYIDELYNRGSLYSLDIYKRAEVRRLIAWFDIKFNYEVTRKIVFERTSKRHLGLGAPNVAIMREGKNNIKLHMDYLSWLLTHRKWLAGDFFSIADITAAAHISSIDYLGSINWHNLTNVKEWYVRIKSRPSMRAILNERISSVSPPDYYHDPDF